MTSNTAKGNYYKNKTREWFRKQGFHVVLTEYTTAIPIKGRTIWIKKDLLGSDGIAMSKERNEFILWNSKGATTKESWKQMKRSGRKDFEVFPFPECVRRQVILWMPRAKDPTIINC